MAPQNQRHLRRDRRKVSDQSDENLTEEEILARFERLVADLDTVPSARKPV